MSFERSLNVLKNPEPFCQVNELLCNRGLSKYFLKLSRATLRMECLFFSSGVISANVLFEPSGRKIGSQPNPREPVGGTIVPFTVPFIIVPSDNPSVSSS